MKEIALNNYQNENKSSCSESEEFESFISDSSSNETTEKEKQVVVITNKQDRITEIILIPTIESLLK